MLYTDREPSYAGLKILVILILYPQLEKDSSTYGVLLFRLLFVTILYETWLFPSLSPFAALKGVAVRPRSDEGGTEVKGRLLHPLQTGYSHARNPKFLEDGYHMSKLQIPYATVHKF
jgi:hypothetical protein